MKLRTGRKEKNNIRPKSGQTIIRVEDLQELIEKNGGEIDEDTLVSMYVPRRNIRRMARDALRLDKVHMLVYGLIALVMILFIFAFMQEKMGNFSAMVVMSSFFFFAIVKEKSCVILWSR